MRIYTNINGANPDFSFEIAFHRKRRIFYLASFGIYPSSKTPAWRVMPKNNSQENIKLNTGTNKFNYIIKVNKNINAFHLHVISPSISVLDSHFYFVHILRTCVKLLFMYLICKNVHSFFTHALFKANWLFCKLILNFYLLNLILTIPTLFLLQGMSQSDLDITQSQEDSLLSDSGEQNSWSTIVQNTPRSSSLSKDFESSLIMNSTIKSNRNESMDTDSKENIHYVVIGHINDPEAVLSEEQVPTIFSYISGLRSEAKSKNGEALMTKILIKRILFKDSRLVILCLNEFTKSWLTAIDLSDIKDGPPCKIIVQEQKMHRYTVKVLYRSKPYSLDEFKLQIESCNQGLQLYNFHFIRSAKLDFMHSLIVFAVDDRTKESIDEYIARKGNIIQFDCLATELRKEGEKERKKRKITHIN